METQPQRKQKQIEIYTYTYMLSNYPSLNHSIPKTQKEKCRIAMSCPFEFYRILFAPHKNKGFLSKRFDWIEKFQQNVVVRNA
jgi:hypothetical protein